MARRWASASIHLSFALSCLHRLCLSVRVCLVPPSVSGSGCPLGPVCACLLGLISGSCSVGSEPSEPGVQEARLSPSLVHHHLLAPRHRWVPLGLQPQLRDPRSAHVRSPSLQARGAPRTPNPYTRDPSGPRSPRGHSPGAAQRPWQGSPRSWHGPGSALYPGAVG